jgi:hypothetical protein
MRSRFDLAGLCAIARKFYELPMTISINFDRRLILLN